MASEDRRAAFFGAIVLGLLAVCGAARADDFEIDVRLGSAGHARTLHGETAGLGQHAKPRTIYHQKAGEPFDVSWQVRNTSARTSKDVVVHFFVVKIEKPGAPVPKLDRDVVAESALTMDFKPKDQARGAIDSIMLKPGLYLLRLETIGAAVGPDGHEYFATAEIEVKP